MSVLGLRVVDVAVPLRSGLAAVPTKSGSLAHIAPHLAAASA